MELITFDCKSVIMSFLKLDLPLRSLFRFSVNAFGKQGPIQPEVEGRAACREGAQSIIECKRAEGPRKVLDF